MTEYLNHDRRQKEDCAIYQASFGEESEQAFYVDSQGNINLDRREIARSKTGVILMGHSSSVS